MTIRRYGLFSGIMCMALPVVLASMAHAVNVEIYAGKSCGTEDPTRPLAFIDGVVVKIGNQTVTTKSARSTISLPLGDYNLSATDPVSRYPNTRLVLVIQATQGRRVVFPQADGSVPVSVTKDNEILIVRMDECALCALSPQEAQSAATAFLKLVPVLNHDRCALCHGRQDVFAKGTAHFGGRFFNEEEVIEGRWSECAECHDAAQRMTGPPEELQWRQAMTSVLKWGGTSPRQLCVAMKSSRLTSVEFTEHLKHDVRLRLAFEGKRGHVTLPAGLTPKPPPLTHANFVATAQQWVNALGGEKNWLPEPCGCETLALQAAPGGNVPPGGGGTGVPPAAGGPTVQPTPTPSPRNPAFEYDVYRSGSDYRNFELPTADPNLCAAQCAREAQCKAWTYLKPGVQANLARCWLKSSVTAPVPGVTFAISGVTRAGAAPPTPTPPQANPAR